MSQLIPFEFENKSVRVVTDEKGEPWFVASDVCSAISVNTEQTRRLDDDEKGLRTVQTLGGSQEMVVINESGLYSLILSSRKPEAKPFKKWVTSEVLPSIRKTGSYTVKPKANSPVKQNIEANRIFKSNLSVAKLIFKGNQATLSANNATRKATGIDVLANLDATALLAETKEVLLTPSDIGKQIGLSSAKVNALLENNGFQQCYRDAKSRKCWKLTAKGEKYAELLDTGKRHGNGTPVKQIKWRESAVSFLH